MTQCKIAKAERRHEVVMSSTRISTASEIIVSDAMSDPYTATSLADNNICLGQKLKELRAMTLVIMSGCIILER